MDLSKIPNTITQFIKKYKFVVLIIIIGLMLMLIPSRNKNTQNQNSTVEIQKVETKSNPQDELASVLTQIKGAGKVQVYLTTAEGEKVVYQTDNDQTNDTKRTQTVTITNDQRGQEGLVSQVNPPVYLGAIVVCDGADNPTVALAIVDAVSKATGLGTNRISVLKMK